MTAQLTGQLAETRALESRLAAVRDAVQDQAARLRGDLKNQRAELRRVIQVAVAPHTEAAQRITERLGSLRGEQSVLTQARPVAAAVDQETQEIATLAPRVGELHKREHQRRARLAPMRQRVEDLSEEFDAILHRFTLPWLENAEVDRTTYLPRVNGVSLKGLSSGGMKTTTNVAYYLANLVTALRDRAILTPSFLCSTASARTPAPKDVTWYARSTSTATCARYRTAATTRGRLPPTSSSLWSTTTCPRSTRPCSTFCASTPTIPSFG